MFAGDDDELWRLRPPLTDSCESRCDASNDASRAISEWFSERSCSTSAVRALSSERCSTSAFRLRRAFGGGRLMSTDAPTGRIMRNIVFEARHRFGSVDSGSPPLDSVSCEASMCAPKRRRPPASRKEAVP